MIFTRTEVDWDFNEQQFDKEYAKFVKEPFGLCKIPEQMASRGYEYSMIAHFANLQPTDIIADIGGGRSYLLPYLSQFSKLAYNIDAGLGGVYTTYRDWYKTYFCTDPFLDGKFVTLRIDARDMPFKDNYFDKVFTVSVFEHIDVDSGDPEGDTQAAQEVYRTLKPGGMFLGTVDFNPITETPVGTVRAYTYESFEKRILEPTGFKLYGEYRKITPMPTSVDYCAIALFFVLIKP